MRHIKAFVVALMLSVSMSFGFGGLAMAADPTQGAKNAVCEGVQSQVGGNCDGNQASNDIEGIVAVVLNLLSFIAGIAAVIMIIIAGLKYITSGGDSSGVAGAKSALIYAIVGIVIVALAQVIVQFVVNETVQ